MDQCQLTVNRVKKLVTIYVVYFIDGHTIAHGLTWLRELQHAFVKEKGLISCLMWCLILIL